ncbi:hypothetical protein VHEMI00841 [[Torrubiella] hemipterigena]|uniref:Uncharacterized protein n=1 Tax=[Torrubiella] hemipterigena TaxID=1531966 RepID=A0A0A1T3N7_9HYPO|nr:hypothetical protein VHEMI00841 [[Torrubiella] hemipterigena]
MRSASAFGAFTFTATVFANLHFDWYIPDAPAQGIRSITFPMYQADAPRISGYYFAQQFQIVDSNPNNGGLGYTGLQPGEDIDGNSTIYAVFSNFGAGVTTSHPQCRGGADGARDGVSCALRFSGSYAPTYNILVENIGGTTWRGTITDTTSGIQRVIGEYTMPPTSGLIQNYNIGFVEYYPWNGKVANCPAQPKTSVWFGKPIAAGVQGTLSGLRHSYPCEGNGQVALSSSPTTNGLTINYGNV